MKILFLLLLPTALLCSALVAHAGVDEEWTAITVLDSGPQKKPSSPEEARLLARNHLLVQKKAIETFLVKYPDDPRAFEARMRLAGILAALGNIDSNQKQINEALRILGELEKTPGVPRDKLADVGFRRVSIFMQAQMANLDLMRGAIVDSARSYASRYPGDRRGPRLLVEAATICDEQPDLKRKLLDQALTLTSEEELKMRINDDLKRLDLLDKPFNLKLSTVNAGEIDFARLRGNVVVLIFWAAESPPSLLWLRGFRNAYDKLPQENLRVVTFSLDEKKDLFQEKLQAMQANWPAHFDGKGWADPIARSLGINSLPTVWIIDKKGVLRALNARESYETWIRKLLRENP